MSSMFWRDVWSRKPHDYNALVGLMKEEIISEEMTWARDCHAQQHYNQGRHASVKSFGGVAHNQSGHRLKSSMHPFSGTGSSYDVEIIEAIPNLHAGLSSPIPNTLAGEAGTTGGCREKTGSPGRGNLSSHRLALLCFHLIKGLCTISIFL
ncbi:Uncharacterized protein Fot_42703 [Forsythia ovata]|uniref:Uncharacterized protein n=1 Tax=Forsythia ovata TaxID=205694 RepID=A0ABD1RLX9_9LAMI